MSDGSRRRSQFVAASPLQLADEHGDDAPERHTTLTKQLCNSSCRRRSSPLAKVAEATTVGSK